MTTKEAIEFLKEVARPIIDEDYGFKDSCEAIDMAIEALIKQVPQRCEEVYADSGNPEREFRYFCCPKCTEEITDDWDYCPSCGQRLE